MSIFGALDTSGSALHVGRVWLDAVSDNIANVNTVRGMNEEAFRQRMLVVQPATGGGVELTSVALGDPQGRVVYQPDHPLADANGFVRYPDVDLADQMVQMMMAQRGYEANLAVVDRARAAYEQALTLGH